MVICTYVFPVTCSKCQYNNKPVLPSMKNRRSAVYVKGFGEQIPVILQCSKLKGFARTVSGDSQLYFRPDSNVYAVLAYFRSTLGKKKDSESYYIVTRSGQILNSSTPLQTAYEQHQSEDGLLHL